MTAKFKHLDKLVRKLKYHPKSNKKTVRGAFMHYSVCAVVAVVLCSLLLGTAKIVFVATSNSSKTKPNAATCLSNCSTTNSSTSTTNSPITPEQTGPTTTKSASSTSTTDSANCTTTPVPYGITDESDNALASGQTQVVSKGVDGSKMSCPAGKGYAAFSNTDPPINEVVDVGTGADALQQQEAEQNAQEATCQSLESQEQTAEQAVQNDETNLHNIEIELGDLGAGGSSQEQALEQQAEAQLSSDQTTYSNLQQESANDNCS